MQWPYFSALKTIPAYKTRGHTKLFGQNTICNHSIIVCIVKLQWFLSIPEYCIDLCSPCRTPCDFKVKIKKGSSCSCCNICLIFYEIFRIYAKVRYFDCSKRFISTPTVSVNGSVENQLHKITFRLKYPGGAGLCIVCLYQ